MLFITSTTAERDLMRLVHERILWLQTRSVTYKRYSMLRAAVNYRRGLASKLYDKAATPALPCLPRLVNAA